MMIRKNLTLNIAASVVLLMSFNTAVRAEPSEQLWPVVKEAFFNNRNIEEVDFIQITGPRRAESGAQVPVTISIDKPQSDANAIKNLYVIVDANPIPLAATYHLHEALGKFELATRIRMETDSYIHVIGEANDGKLFMSKTSIRAAGGCGGTVDGDDAEVRASAGKIKLQVENPIKLGQETPTTFIIKHPMRTGLQRDLVSQGYVPAFYIQKAAFTFNNKPVMNVDFGVGTSEDPYLRFNFIADAPGVLQVKAEDNEGTAFSNQITLTN